MPDQPRQEPSSAFTKVFVPGLVLGLIAGIAIGVLVGPLLDRLSGPKLTQHPPGTTIQTPTVNNRDARPPEQTQPPPTAPEKPAEKPSEKPTEPPASGAPSTTPPAPSSGGQPPKP
jgi:hypothetical protein